MGLLNADQAKWAVENYRICWITGRVSGHKTSFAFELARGWLEQGYRLVTNTRCVWADDPQDVHLDENGLLHCVVVLDEGGLSLQVGRQVQMIMSYPAKMDIILMIPSYWPPAQNAKTVTIQPVFNLKSAGIPLVFYKWRIRCGGMDDSGSFAWWDPSSIYGIYSRRDPGESAKKIVRFLVQRTEEYRKYFGHDDEDDDAVSEMENNSSPIGRLENAVDGMAEVANTLEAVSLRSNKRKRRF